MPESRHGSGIGSTHDPGPASAKGDPAAAGGSVAPDPLIGRSIDGRFRIKSLLARGGMGKVYVAEQAPLGRLCALKVLSPKYEGDHDPEFQKRFFLEAATAAKLSHANTVTVFDYGKAEADDLYFIAMELIEGRTLHRVLRDEGPFNEDRVRLVASQICRSLREAHGLGVVHRDLKPGNIMLTDKGDERDSVKVLDFGLVKDVTDEAEDLTQAGLFMGSPKYMAPEQILGSEITARADIYSLGVMLYEMLTGKVPFDRGASVGTLMAHVNDPVPSLQDANPNVHVSPQMDAIVRRCLEKDANKRFASMKDLLSALKRSGGEQSMRETFESLPAPVMPRGSDAPPSASRLKALRLGKESDVASDLTLRESAAPAPPADTDPRLASARPKRSTYLWGVALSAFAVLVGAAVVSRNGQKPEVHTLPVPVATAIVAPPPAAVTAVETAASSPSPPVLAPHRVHVETDPSGASISEGGTEVCPSTPCDVVFGAEPVDHKLSVSKKGYKSAKQIVSATESQVSVKLDAVVTSAPQSANKKPENYKPDPYK